MVAIEVNFLTGRYVATAHHDRRRPEWPPDPARLFSALVATWADADAPDPRERRALEWLEARPAPGVVASDAVERRSVRHFVPVNDVSVISPAAYRNRVEKHEQLREALTEALFESDGEITQTVRGLRTRIRASLDVSNLVTRAGGTSPGSATGLLPSGRGRQERWFPSVTPDVSQVTYIWDAAPPSVESALDGLLARVTRLGHSSSLVSCRLRENPPAPNLVPGEGSMFMRSIGPGQLAALEHAHLRHRAIRPRALPFVAVRYGAAPNGAEPARHLRADTAGEWLIFELAPSSRRFPSSRTVEVTSTLRKAIFRYADDPLPEGLSGHHPDGMPSTAPHAGFMALPWVGGGPADGRLMGVAVGLPDGLDGESRHALLRAVGTWERSASPMSLAIGRRVVLHLERRVAPSALATLRPETWRHPSRRWVSATPVALPAHPGRLTGGTTSAHDAAWRRAARAVVDSCGHVGLPEPADVDVSLEPFIAGALPAFRFPAFHQGGRNGRPVARRLVHAAVTFDRPLEGPLLLGAGRYLGLGLMRPVPVEDGGHG